MAANPSRFTHYTQCQFIFTCKSKTFIRVMGKLKDEGINILGYTASRGCDSKELDVKLVVGRDGQERDVNWERFVRDTLKYNGVSYSINLVSYIIVPAAGVPGTLYTVWKKLQDEDIKVYNGYLTEDGGMIFETNSVARVADIVLSL